MRLVHLFSYSALSICYLSLFIFLCWLLYPYKVLEYYDLPLPVINKEVKPGGVLLVKNNFCKLMETQVTIYPSFEDGVIFNLIPVKGSTTKGCYDRIGYYKVPEVLSPGDKVRLHLQLDYQVNPVRTITYHIYSEVFTIATPSATLN